MYSSFRQWIVFGAVCAALTISGCEQGASDKWDWFGTKKTAEAPKTQTRPKYATTTGKSGAKPAAPQDVQSKEVDANVERYVQSMNSTYKPNYESNDFNSKIRRQQDPNRNARIQQTATRQKLSGNEMAAHPVDEIQPPAGYEARKPAVIPAPQSTAKPRQTERAVNPNPEPVAEPISIRRQKEGQQQAKPVAPAPVEAAPTGPINDTPETIKPVEDDPEASLAETAQVSPDAGLVAHSQQNQKSRPPTLADIEITAAPAPAKVEEPVPSHPPVNVKANAPVVTQAPADTMQTRIAEQEARVAKDPNNIEEQFRLRLMYLADAQDEKAMATTSGINADILEIMRGQIQALLTARTNAQRDPALWANRQMEAIENLRELVRARADLKVAKVAICRAITSFGVYEPIDPPDFKASQRNAMFLYVPIENFKTQRMPSGMYRTLLSIRYSVLDSAGKELWSDKIDNIEDVAREHRQDFYLGVGPEGGFVLPPRWGPGDYTVKVEVEDMLAQKINSNTTKFRIVS
jgi:hypothetical protein